MECRTRSKGPVLRKKRGRRARPRGGLGPFLSTTNTAAFIRLVLAASSIRQRFALDSRPVIYLFIYLIVERFIAVSVVDIYSNRGGLPNAVSLETIEDISESVLYRKINWGISSLVPPREMFYQNLLLSLFCFSLCLLTSVWNERCSAQVMSTQRIQEEFVCPNDKRKETRLHRNRNLLSTCVHV